MRCRTVPFLACVGLCVAVVRGGVPPDTPSSKIKYVLSSSSCAPTQYCLYKSEDFFRAPEEEVQRVFDFLGLERADVSLKAYEEAKVKKYVAAPRSVGSMQRERSVRALFQRSVRELRMNPNWG